MAKAKPLISDDPKPQSMQFAHFGVLNDGNQSKSSLFTSIALNVLLAFCAVVIGAAAKKTIDNRHKLTELTEPIPIKKAEEPPPPKIKIKLPPPPPVAKIEPPKIKLPEVKLPDPPKMPEVKMTQPVPVITPAPPKLVQPPPAPKVVSLAQAMPASVPNNSPHPTAVALGSTTNPIAVSNKPSATAINLGNKGMSGMPASNNGAGAQSTVVSLGSGSPTGQNMKASGPVAVAGIPHGVTGGTGPLNSTSKVVSLGQNTPPPMPKPAGPTMATAKSGPKVLFKPKPEYTAEAKQLRIEGNVTVRIRVSSTGAVQVLGVISDLGHGLGDSAVHAIEATRFKPATDDSGNPVDWEGVVNVAFQLAG
ncbi:MAG TPA: TonB family protein [Edaphobacter sp.]|jgi:periplasmic protein TonB|nr:TonB family protein [Edaphobacter sp.]